MAITLALLAALSWGVQGLLLKYSTTKVNTLATMYASYVVGGVMLLPFVIFKISELITLPFIFFIWLLLAVAINVSAKFFYYHALKIGKVVIVIPIVAAYSLVTLVLSLFAGELLSLLQLALLMAIVLGMALASIKSKVEDSSQSGALWATASAICYGLSLWISGNHLRSYLDGELLSWLFFVTQGFCLGTVHITRRLPLELSHLNLLFFTGLTGAIGSVLLTVALGNNQNGTVAVLSSLNGVFSVILAWIFLKEKLMPLQWIGIWIALSGVIVIGVLR